MGGPNLKKTCPDCGGEMDHGATRCRACYDKRRIETRMPYRGKNPLKLCPGCGQEWILNHSQFCWKCHNLRRTKAWKEKKEKEEQQANCIHHWIEAWKEKQEQQANCVHHWILDDNNYGVCQKCGAGKQFATPKEQAYILARAFQIQKEPALLDEELIQEVVMV